MIYFTEIGKLGQLGNQMFQYAALVAVAENFNYEFQIDFTATELSRAFILSAIDQKLVPSQVFSFKEKPHTFDKNLLGNNQYVDLCMMTLCDHNIISTIATCTEPVLSLS